jgi:hypothetical protein
MPTKAYMESVKSNKEKEDHSTGKKIPQVKGTALFSVPLKDASIYDKQEVYIYTEEEHNRKKSENPQSQLNVVGESLKTFGMVLRDLEAEFNKLLESQEG